MMPTGSQAVPATEPESDYNAAKGRWDQSNFVRCILEGCRQVRSKPINWKTGTHRTGGEEAPGKQNPTTFFKDHTSSPSGPYPREARILQHLQINQCDTPH